MITLDAVHVEQTACRQESVYYEPKMKYNPSSHTLSHGVDVLNVQPGQALISILKDASFLGTQGIVSTEQLHRQLLDNATASVCLKKLPTFADYEYLEDLHDLEQTEIAAYEASRKFIW